jgi:ribonuclease G
MQSAFVNLGLERDAFLYVSDFLEQTGEEYDRVAVDERPRRTEPRSAVPPIATVNPVPVVEAVVPPPVVVESPAATPPRENRDANRDRDNRDRGGDDRGRRGRRSRRRRRTGGRGFPESKYSSPADVSGTPNDTIEEEDDADTVEALVLPGESIAKYSQRPDIEEAEQDAAPVSEQGEPEESLDRFEEPLSAVASEIEPEPVVLTKELKEEVKELVEELEEDAALDAAQEAAEAALAAEQEATYSSVIQEPQVASVEVVAASGEPGESDIAGESEAAAFTESVAETEDVDEVDTEAEGQSGSDDEQAAAVDELPEEESPASEPEPESSPEGEPQEISAEVREDQPTARYIQRGNRRIRRRGGRGGDRGGDRPDRGGEARSMPPGERPAVERPAVERPAIERPDRSGEARAMPLGERPERTERPDSRQVSRPDREKPPLPSISDLLKEGQEIIVQIFKEPLGQKGARITSHVAMPGRYVVYMPTLDHLGVSRKVASDEERIRLKRIVQTHAQGMTGGFIVRTAGEGKTDAEIGADMTFLYNQWLEIRKRAEKRPAPLLLHHDLELVTRTLRDQVNEQFKAVWVDSEEVYEAVVGFLERFQPLLVNRVKLYTRDLPIFDTFNITTELEKALRPKVWLKSGGYIVVNQTEALVAVDINTGKYVGKSNRLEDTIVKTNLEAVKEIVRQIRLRDLGGIIVIDFIDMDERKNRQKVMQALEEAMRTDRAPYKILQFNDFGLVAITRRRVKQSLERALCQPCTTCEGAGYVKSVQTVVGEILTEAYKIAPALEGKDVMLRVHPDVAKELKRTGENYIAELEEILGRTLIVKSDPLLHPEKFDLA